MHQGFLWFLRVAIRSVRSVCALCERLVGTRLGKIRKVDEAFDVGHARTG